MPEADVATAIEEWRERVGGEVLATSAATGSGLEELAAAIRTVAEGGTLFRPALGARVLQGLQRAPTAFEASQLPEPLTPREKEILALLANGSSNKEIAAALGTAEGTVKNQVSSIMAKLGVRDRTRAVLRGIELGYF